MYRTVLLPLLLVGYFFLAACSDGSVSEAPPGAVLPDFSIQYARVDPSTLSSEKARRETALQDHAVMSRFVEIASRDQSVEEFEREVRAEIERTRPGARAKAAQLGSALLLRRLLSEPGAPPEHRRLAAVYVTLLAQHKSPETVLIEEGLKFSEDAMTNAERGAVASMAVEAGFEYLAAKSDCESCSSEEALARISERIAAEHAVRLTEMESAVARLQGVARGEV